MESPLPSPRSPPPQGTQLRKLESPPILPPNLLRLVPSSPRPTSGFLSECSLRCESWKQRFTLQRKDAPDANSGLRSSEFRRTAAQRRPGFPWPWERGAGNLRKAHARALRSANQPQARDSCRPVLVNPDCAKLPNRLELWEECPRFCCPSVKGRAGERLSAASPRTFTFIEPLSAQVHEIISI